MSVPWSCMSSQPQYRFAVLKGEDDDDDNDDVASVRLSSKVGASMRWIE
jgi:hypothetical protein